MIALFKKIIINTGDAEYPENQIYVANADVTAEQVLAGDDSGVLAYCMTEQAAEMIVAALNNGGTSA